MIESMGEDGNGRSLRRQQADFFDAFFRKGADFARELIEENEELRRQLRELELGGGSPERGRELADRYDKIERENNDLAALYVAQSHLHGSLEASEVVRVVHEILINFVGATRFGIVVSAGGDDLALLAGYGVEPGELPPLRRGEGVIGQVVATREVVVGELRRAAPAEDDPVVCIPLCGRSDCFGAIAIWDFLSHKAELVPVDRQLFELLGHSGGKALEAARLVGDLRRRAPTEPNVHAALWALTRR